MVASALVLSRAGTAGQRAAAVRRALKAQGYQLKSRGHIADVAERGHFAIVALQTGAVVAGGSTAAPELSLAEVEDWFDAQFFRGQVALDGTLLPDLPEEQLSSAQRKVLKGLKALPNEERLQLLRYILARLPI